MAGTGKTTTICCTRSCSAIDPVLKSMHISHWLLVIMVDAIRNGIGVLRMASFWHVRTPDKEVKFVGVI